MLKKIFLNDRGEYGFFEHKISIKNPATPKKALTMITNQQNETKRKNQTGHLEVSVAVN